MRNRYQLRNAAGEVLSPHNSVIGAVEALGHIRAKAERDGVEPTAYIWDAAKGCHVEPTIDALVESVGLHVSLTAAENATLRQIAGELGVLAERGGRKGEPGHQPSRAGLVRGIARREFVVSRPATGGEGKE